MIRILVYLAKSPLTAICRCFASSSTSAGLRGSCSYTSESCKASSSNWSIFILRKLTSMVVGDK